MTPRLIADWILRNQRRLLASPLPEADLSAWVLVGVWLDERSRQGRAVHR